MRTRYGTPSISMAWPGRSSATAYIAHIVGAYCNTHLQKVRILEGEVFYFYLRLILNLRNPHIVILWRRRFGRDLFRFFRWARTHASGTCFGCEVHIGVLHTKKRERVRNNFRRLTLASLLRFPAAGLDPSGNVGTHTFLRMCCRERCKVAPEDDVVKLDALLVCTRCFVFPVLICGNADREDTLTAGCGPDFGVTGDIPENVGTV